MELINEEDNKVKSSSLNNSVVKQMTSRIKYNGKKDETENDYKVTLLYNIIKGWEKESKWT